MSLCILACACGGVDSLTRGVLRQAGVPNWMTYEVHKGKEHCRTVLSRFPTQLHPLLAFRALESHLENNGTFAVIIGYDDNSFFWGDVHTNAPKDVFDTINIVKAFA